MREQATGYAVVLFLGIADLVLALPRFESGGFGVVRSERGRRPAKVETKVWRETVSSRVTVRSATASL
ncbi:hypothetical protein CHELA20_51792 [Hyphomicrobiales bacterium]|nr:hypothetical protein CHELA41_23221 [Hyphomicrobiales bacterium]CAH1678537.1 hypothetical protein CHELA20_51792 [Hyphomicrobiales bacterium]